MRLIFVFFSKKNDKIVEKKVAIFSEFPGFFFQKHTIQALDVKILKDNQGKYELRWFTVDSSSTNFSKINHSKNHFLRPTPTIALIRIPLFSAFLSWRSA